MGSMGDGSVARGSAGAGGVVTRKEVLRLGVALVGGVAASSVIGSTVAHAGNGTGGQGGGASHGRVGDPRPVPGGFNDDLTGFVPSDPLIHAYAPVVGLDMSTITDFKGVVAACELQGIAHGSDGVGYSFDVDIRFMDGTYIDLQGRRQEHAFGFV
jgi:hypothetical protein